MKQLKHLKTHLQYSPYNICNKIYATPETHTPAGNSMSTVTRHGSSKWRLQMRARAPLTNSQDWSFSLWSPRTLWSHCACMGPTRRMHPTLSEWLHALSSTDPRKGRVWAPSFFLGYHITRVGSGQSRQTDVLNQALPIIFAPALIIIESHLFFLKQGAHI
jgi:hypothetical protein